MAGSGSLLPVVPRLVGQDCHLDLYQAGNLVPKGLTVPSDFVYSEYMQSLEALTLLERL